MKRELIIFLIAPLAGASTSVSGIESTGTQAVMRIQTTEPGACTVEVSTSPAYSPLVIDVDPALFAGANLDSREPYLVTGGQRIFIAGKRLTQRDSAGVPRSRALQANTLHYYRIHCGADTVTGTFLTGVSPFGLSYPDPIPIDPLSAGDPLWPALDYQDKTKAYIDPHNGIQIKRVTGPGDQEYKNFSLNVTWGALNIARAPASGNAWTAASFPASITNNNTDYLVLRLDTSLTGGAGGTDFGLFNLSSSYSSELLAALSNFQTSLTGSINQSSCNSVATNDCKLVVCASVDGVTCHPSSAELEMPLTTTGTARTLGNQTYVDLGGWIKPGRRPINTIEAAARSGTAVCDGSTVVTGGPFNLSWTAGSLININGVSRTVASVQHEARITLTSACAAGTYGFTSKNFSLLVRAKTANSNTITLTAGSTQVHFGLSPAAPAGETEDICGFVTVNDSNGEPGYVCFANIGMVWVSAVTGEGRYLMPLWVVDGSGFHELAYPLMTFDGNDADTLYGMSLSAARVFKYTYKGAHTDASFQGEAAAPVCDNPTNPSNPPCLAITELTAGASSLPDLVQAFDPGFDKNKWAAFPIGTNPYHGAFVILYKRNDGTGNGQNNSFAWLAVFDPQVNSNVRPGNAGCISAVLGNSNPGCIIAAMPAYGAPGMRGVDTKGSVSSDVDFGFAEFGPFFTCLNTNQSGGGCLKVDIGGGFAFSGTTDAPGGPGTCPPNNFGITGKNCTQVLVNDEPYDPSPAPNETGVPGEYLIAAEGDILCINCTTVGGFGAQVLGGNTTTELVRLIAKRGNTWTLQRHFQYGFANTFCHSPNCVGGSPVARASTANPSLWYSGWSGQTFWDFVHDPYGTHTTLDERDLGVHSYMRRGVMIQAAGQVPNPPCVDQPSGCYMLRYSPSPLTPDLVAPLDPTGFAISNPPFAGKTGVAEINGTQSHPSAPGLAADEVNRAMFYDNRPYNGIFGSSAGAPQAANVSGSLWKFAAGAIALNRKQLPTHATNGVHLLTDVSGPGSSIGTGGTDKYKFCVVQAANECRAGSIAGEIYFNAPALQFNFCLSPGQATSGADLTDVCIHDQSLADDGILQFSAVGSDPFGLKQRMLTQALAGPRVNSPFWNMFLVPDSHIGVTRSKFINNYRSDLISIKMPPLNSDSRSRGDFQPVPVTIPASQFGFAQIEWGYAENGSDGVNNLFCTSRQDNCRTGGSPFQFASETQTPVACSTGCSIAIPAVGSRTVYYRVLRTNSSGGVLARGEVRVVVVP